MSLRDTLETSFSGDGLDADALLQQIADLYRALDLPASAFDPASIADQLQVLGDIDPSDITGLLDASLQRGGRGDRGPAGAGEELAALREADIRAGRTRARRHRVAGRPSRCPDRHAPG